MSGSYPQAAMATVMISDRKYVVAITLMDVKLLNGNATMYYINASPVGHRNKM